MKLTAVVLLMSFAPAISAGTGPGSGGQPNGTPHNNGGGTTGGVVPEPGFHLSQWTALVTAAYADGIVSGSERREIFRFLRTLPRIQRARCLSSWLTLKATLRGNTNPAVSSGIVASWAQSDPGAAADWLNSLPGR